MSSKSTVTIVTTRDSEGFHHLRIKDELSGSTVCEVVMSPEQFSGQLTGSSMQQVPVTWSNLDRLGKRREVKTEVVMVDGKSWERETRITSAKKAIAEFEVDGWVGHLDDAMNMHNRVGSGPKAPEDTARDGVIGDAYRVSFVRFVETDS